MEFINYRKKLAKVIVDKDVVEKPSVKNAPSNKAVIGRYILPKKIFLKLSSETRKRWRNHVKYIQSLINEDEPFTTVFMAVFRLWKYEWFYQIRFRECKCRYV